MDPISKEDMVNNALKNTTNMMIKVLDDKKVLASAEDILNRTNWQSLTESEIEMAIINFAYNTQFPVFPVPMIEEPKKEEEYFLSVRLDEGIFLSIQNKDIDLVKTDGSAGCIFLGIISEDKKSVFLSHISVDWLEDKEHSEEVELFKLYLTNIMNKFQNNVGEIWVVGNPRETYLFPFILDFFDKHKEKIRLSISILFYRRHSEQLRLYQRKEFHNFLGFYKKQKEWGVLLEAGKPLDNYQEVKQKEYFVDAYFYYSKQGKKILIYPYGVKKSMEYPNNIDVSFNKEGITIQRLDQTYKNIYLTLDDITVTSEEQARTLITDSEELDKALLSLNKFGEYRISSNIRCSPTNYIVMDKTYQAPNVFFGQVNGTLKITFDNSKEERFFGTIDVNNFSEGKYTISIKPDLSE